MGRRGGGLGAAALAGDDGLVQVGTSDDDPPPYDHRRNCGECDAGVEAAIEAFTATADASALEESALPGCSCRAEWLSLFGTR